jgi:hypothetical protein
MELQDFNASSLEGVGGDRLGCCGEGGFFPCFEVGLMGSGCSVKCSFSGSFTRDEIRHFRSPPDFISVYRCILFSKPKLSIKLKFV